MKWIRLPPIPLALVPWSHVSPPDAAAGRRHGATEGARHRTASAAGAGGGSDRAVADRGDPAAPGGESRRRGRDRRAARDAFSGAILVARSGKPVFEHAYGRADREKKVPNQMDTVFRIASMNKMFTGVAVVQLAQAGKLSFTDPLAKHVPEYPNQDVAAKVTIHHLLTHTGGTGDIFGPEFAARRKSIRDIKSYVDFFGARGLAFEPGSQ